MQLRSDSFTDGGTIPDHLALAVPADPVVFSENRNPHLAWSGVPEGTGSLVVTCIDHHCPSAPDDVNQSDREVPVSLPSVDFTHWLLADLPPDLEGIAEGSHSEGVVEGGKASDAAPVGVHGVNDYTAWFEGDPDLGGEWHGYDGPAPPWNDSILHEYEFTVYAVDTETLGLNEGFTRDELEAALDGHVIDSASIAGSYALNTRLR